MTKKKNTYNRQGSKGVKAKSLRQELTYYKKQYERRLIEQQAASEARGFSFNSLPFNPYQKIDYNTIMKEGVSRKIDSKTVYFYGEEAVRLQIESLKKSASKTYQHQVFITNYLNALAHVGMTPNNILKIKDMLEAESIDKISLLIDKAILPDIQFLYASNDSKSEDEYVEEIQNAIKYGISTQEVKDFRAKRKALIPLIKAKQELLK